MSTDLATVGMDEQSAGGAMALPTNQQMPAFLAKRLQEGHAPAGVENLKQYFVPPRLKVIQGQSDPDIKDIFGEGAVIVVPAKIPIVSYSVEMKRSASFTFIPLFSFTEWGIVNPRNTNDKDGNKLPFLRERTSDHKHEIAKRARDFKTPGARYAQCPEAPNDPQKQLRYVEFINFLCLIEGIRDLAMPVHFSFWSTGHTDGRNLSNLIMSKGVDIFAQRFEAMVTPRKNPKGNWYGLTVTTPYEKPAFVQTQEEMEQYERMHLNLKKMHADREMQMDYEDDPASSEPVLIDPNAPQEY